MKRQRSLPFPANKLGQGDSTFLDLPIMAFLGNNYFQISEEGFAILFETSNGPFLERVEGCRNLPAGTPMRIFRTHISEDVWAQMSWMHVPNALAFFVKGKDIDEHEFKELCKDDDPAVRAECLMQAADKHGWEKIDDEPLLLTQDELCMRWYGTTGLKQHAPLN